MTIFQDIFDMGTNYSSRSIGPDAEFELGLPYQLGIRNMKDEPQWHQRKVMEL